MKHKGFKDGVFWCLFCISMVTTIMLFVFIVDTVVKVNQVQTIKREGTYQNEKAISFDGGLTNFNAEYPKRDSYTEENEKLLELSEIDDMMVCVQTSVVYGETKRVAGLNVIMNRFTPKFPLEEGNYNDGEDGIYIGQGFLPFLIEENGDKYLLIENEYYKVNGVFKDNTGDQSDQRIFVYYQNLNQTMREKVLDSVFPFLGIFYVYSDYQDIEPSMKVIFDWTDRYYIKALEQYEVELERFVEDRTTVQEDNDFFVRGAMGIVGLMIGFCYYSVLLSSKLWIRKFQRDLVVLKAFGCGRFMIVQYFYGKLLLMYGATFLIIFIWFHNAIALITLFIAFSLVLFITIVPLLKVLKDISISNLVEVIDEV